MSCWRTRDFLALLADLDRLEVRYGTDDDMQLFIDAPAGVITADLAANIRMHRHLLLWTVIARGTGHVWCPCDRCGQPVLLNPALHGDGNGHQVWPRCYVTPGCCGRHQFINKRTTP
jgi:hypothetical protein